MLVRLFVQCLHTLLVVCLIGCSCTQHSKTPWKLVAKAIKVLNKNEERRSLFIKEFEALYQKHKYDSEEFGLKLADVIILYAAVISANVGVAIRIGSQ